MAKSLRYDQLLQLAVAEGATTPNPGITGVLAYSTILGSPVHWTGAQWTAGSAGGGSGDVVGPASSTDGHLLVSSGTTGKVLREASWFDTQATGIPAAPAAGDLRWFGISRAGRILPHIIGPSGIDVALQPGLFGNSIYMWLPGTGTTLSIAWGSSWTARNNGTSAAQAHPTKASTNNLTSMNRATFSTGTTTTGTSGVQSSATVAWRGNATGLGGFFFFARFGVETYRSDIRVLVGLSALNAALAGDPSAQANSCGICKDAADTNWQIFVRSGSTATKIDTGVPVAAGDIFDLMMFAPPNGSGITFRVVNTMTNAVVVDNEYVSTNLPAATTFMYAQARIMSTTGTTAAILALNRIYVECDL